jgi:hypothetical protein
MPAHGAKYYRAFLPHVTANYALTGRNREGGNEPAQTGRSPVPPAQPGQSPVISALRSATPGSPPWFPGSLTGNQLEGRGRSGSTPIDPALPNRARAYYGAQLGLPHGRSRSHGIQTTPSASPRASRRRRPTAVLDAAAPGLKHFGTSSTTSSGEVPWNLIAMRFSRS